MTELYLNEGLYHLIANSPFFRNHARSCSGEGMPDRNWKMCKKLAPGTRNIFETSQGSVMAKSIVYYRRIFIELYKVR